MQTLVLEMRCHDHLRDDFLGELKRVLILGQTLLLKTLRHDHLEEMNLTVQTFALPGTDSAVENGSPQEYGTKDFL